MFYASLGNFCGKDDNGSGNYLDEKTPNYHNKDNEKGGTPESDFN